MPEPDWPYGLMDGWLRLKYGKKVYSVWYIQYNVLRTRIGVIEVSS